MASPRTRLERVALVVFLTLAAGGADAALYRWVDDKGVVQYSDKPPDGKGKAGVEMSKRGIVMKKLDTPLTPEQQKAKDEEEAKQRLEAQQASAQRRADQALLQSFTSVQEIDLKRDREVQALEGVIATLRTQERTAADRLAENRKRLESYAKRNAQPPASLAEEIARGEADVKITRGNIDKRQQDIAATRSQYEGLKKRYLELRAAEKSAAAALPASASTAKK